MRLEWVKCEMNGHSKFLDAIQEISRGDFDASTLATYCLGISISPNLRPLLCSPCSQGVIPGVEHVSTHPRAHPHSCSCRNPESASLLILAPCTTQSGPSLVSCGGRKAPHSPSSRVCKRALPPLESLHDVHLLALSQSRPP